LYSTARHCVTTRRSRCVASGGVNWPQKNVNRSVNPSMSISDGDDGLPRRTRPHAASPSFTTAQSRSGWSLRDRRTTTTLDYIYYVPAFSQRPHLHRQLRLFPLYRFNFFPSPLAHQLRTALTVCATQLVGMHAGRHLPTV